MFPDIVRITDITYGVIAINRAHIYEICQDTAVDGAVRMNIKFVGSEDSSYRFASQQDYDEAFNVLVA